MANGELQNRSNRELSPSQSRRADIEYINQSFGVGTVVAQLHLMMKEVVKGGINANNVHAACNCVSRLNDTINTTINAAKFLKEK